MKDSNICSEALQEIKKSKVAVILIVQRSGVEAASSTMTGVILRLLYNIVLGSNQLTVSNNYNCFSNFLEPCYRKKGHTSKRIVL